jgi:alpha-amylase
MGVALIAWGRFVVNGNRITVPAPPTDPGKPWLWDFLAAEASALRGVGFTAIQLPPASKVQGGAGAGCDGYGVFDPRDLGTKPQQGSTPTRYGTGDSLRRLVACCHAVGMDVYLDVVLHQLMGENGGPGVFRYLGADGKTLNGRGAMQPGCFRGATGNNDPIPPFRHEDAVPAPADDFPFGREKVYQNSDPAGFTAHDAIDYGDWLFRTTGADGMRFDDVKGTWAPFVAQFMRSRTMASKFAYAEYFDGNPDSLNWWATSSPMSSRSLVEDFTLHWALQAACDGGNARALDGAGYIARNPFMACTFVDNPDTDTSPGEAIISNKLLAYAFLLTTQGYPFVYGKDYFTGQVWPGAYGLKPWIDNLIWIHETLANGPTVTRWLDNSVIVLNRTGARPADRAELRHVEPA